MMLSITAMLALYSVVQVVRGLKDYSATLTERLSYIGQECASVSVAVLFSILP